MRGKRTSTCPALPEPIAPIPIKTTDSRSTYDEFPPPHVMTFVILLWCLREVMMFAIQVSKYLAVGCNVSNISRFKIRIGSSLTWSIWRKIFLTLMMKHNIFQ